MLMKKAQIHKSRSKTINENINNELPQVDRLILLKIRKTRVIMILKR